MLPMTFAVPAWAFLRRLDAMYKEFAAEVVMWLVPVVVLIGVALLVTH
ncbi:hypothetical protein SAMN05421874_102283 [Nonomuraea maritima]|uniref:Uncharacterized protein n=1 Tax=Nonomuraea maritima TaxID=683260 RepID=A0A1G8UX59_9ACTN|nr:hypothetical protein SAMN05421874_102283 [Nonomuraea maritima]